METRHQFNAAIFKTGLELQWRIVVVFILEAILAVNSDGSHRLANWFQFLFVLLGFNLIECELLLLYILLRAKRNH